MSKGKQAPRNRRGKGWRIALLVVLLAIFVICSLTIALIARFGTESTSSDRVVTLRVAYSPEKEALFQQLADGFAATGPEALSGKRIELAATSLNPDQMVEPAVAGDYQAISPDSSLWLGDVDRLWHESQGTDSDLVGETVRYMISPVVVAMWPDVAAGMGYPEQEIGWEDILAKADSDPDFAWSHPSTSSSSGLLATLAEFYVGAGVTRGLDEALATAPETIDYVARLEHTVKYYGEGELAVLARIRQEGRGGLDAFVAQEQLVIDHNRQGGESLVAIYPAEGTLWLDHPLAILEHPDLSEDERDALRQLRDYVLSPEAQAMVLRAGYRPADLTVRLDGADSPISEQNGVDPAKPYTTMQIPSASVVEVVKNAWWYTKRHTNVYLVVDVSGSMQGRELEDAQMALHSFLDQIVGGDERVGLISFSSGVDERVPLVRMADGRERLETAVNLLEAGGNTAMLDGVELAYTKLRDLNDQERINAILVMTDGKENSSSVSIRALTARLQDGMESDLPIVVFCIAYGNNADLGTLRMLSDATGGVTKYGDVESIDDLYRTLSTYF